MNNIVKSIFDKETLIRNLRIARMDIYYRDFIKKSVMTALMISIMVNIFFFFVLSGIAESSNSNSLLLLLFLTFPISFYALVVFFLKTPEVKVIRSRKNIEAEIVSAIRFMILDLKANAPIYDSLQNITKNFEEIGKYMNDITTKVNLGSSLERSLNEEVEIVPSEELRVFFWQVINHIQTGTDITHSLSVLADEIVEKQRIEFKKYGKKLNALSLFYMIVAIILPTIGFTMISAALIFIGFKINMSLILGFWIMFSIMQLMFLALSGGNRPVVES